MMEFQQCNLTDRELETLFLIAHGHSAKEAGRTLGLTSRTVETHLDRIRLKLGARNRTHMVAMAIASDILPFEIAESRRIKVYRSAAVDRKMSEEEGAPRLVLGEGSEITIR